METTLPAGAFFGEVLHHYQSDRFLLHEAVYPPHLEIPEHSHENAYFCFVLTGEYTETYDRRRRTCRPTMLIFHPPGEVHSDRFAASHGRLFNLEIPASTLALWGQYAPRIDRPIEWEGGDPTWLATRLYSEFRNRDAISPLAMEGLVLEIFAGVSRSLLHRPASGPRWLEQTEQLLRASYADPPTLQQIARHVDVHPVHLARAFRQQHRCTIGDYVRRLRIEFACRQLSGSALSLGEIALTAGFTDQSHFSRIFKRVTGMTPGQYRSVYFSR